MSVKWVLSMAAVAASAFVFSSVVPEPARTVMKDGEFRPDGDFMASISYVDDSAIPDEGYFLAINPDGIEIASSGAIKAG